jgi:hypothetical protein
VTQFFERKQKRTSQRRCTSATFMRENTLFIDTEGARMAEGMRADEAATCIAQI